jgi:hypothetical protein
MPATIQASGRSYHGAAAGAGLAADAAVAARALDAAPGSRVSLCCSSAIVASLRLRSLSLLSAMSLRLWTRVARSSFDC